MGHLLPKILVLFIIIFTATGNLKDSDIPKKEQIEMNSVKPVFLIQNIPDDVYNNMIGKSIPKEYKNDVDIASLSYLKISYWGFDDKTHIGEMIVNKDVASEVIDIFKELFNAKYKIEKIKLIDEYDANDEKSMADNNSSAFCYRKIANSNILSNHAKGLAIDINPLYNPYIVGNSISPKNAEAYANRSKQDLRYIKEGDVVYNAFIKRGWTWGGSWSNKKDYQHFEKAL